MTSKDLKFSRIKNYNDIDFELEITNENSLQLSEECRQIKETVLSNLRDIFKEYFERIKLKKEISILDKEQTSVSYKKKELHKKLQIIKEDKDNAKKHITSLKKNIKLYEENLAFKIKDEGNIKKGEVYRSFVFSNIVEEDSQKTCSIVLKITDKNNSKLYEAMKCHPDITGLEELVSRLNKTNDEHSFIVNVRKKFQQSFAETV